jgi:F-type H+-transporting ATPase subunit gamma
MANLKEVRTRIESVKSTRQITSAMKLVAASKLRKAQNAILALRPYNRKLQEIMGHLSQSIGSSAENAFLSQREVKKVLLVVINSNKGLCGSFNANIIKAATRHRSEAYASLPKEDVHVVSIGKKATAYFKSDINIRFEGHHDDLFDDLTFSRVSELAGEFMTHFEAGHYDRVELIYNRFINAASQEVRIEQLLPLESSSETEQQNTDYIFEPGKVEIFTEVIPRSIKIHLYKALLDSYAAEQGARMTAMHQATDNATGLIKELQLSYNKARQEAITNEINEVTTGAEALKG